MTGLLGDTGAGETLERLDALATQPWMEREVFESANHSLGLVSAGERDPGGWTWWTDGSRAGAVYGSMIVPASMEPRSVLFERLLASPVEVLPALEGGFVVVAMDADADRIVLATDKLGTRPCYYTDDAPIRFGTRLRPLLETAGSFTLDRQAVSDLLLNGYLWGDETLASEVTALPPATALVDDGTGRTRTRYWKPDFSRARPSDEYLATTARRYREAVEAMAGTVQGELGLWLSGGLDSRSLLAVLTAVDDPEAIRTYTYDSNPVGGRNPELARRIAAMKNVDNRTVTLDSTQFFELFRDAIDATDGMLRWNSLLNLSAVFALPDDSPAVMAEAAGQGEFLGEQIRRKWLTEPESAVESMRRSEASLAADRVAELLAYDVDPLASFKREAARSDEPTTERVILDTHFQNHYARFVYASDNMARTRVENRVPFAYGPFLEHAAKLPTAYRMGSFPFTGGSIPYGASRPKLELIRMLDASLSGVPYERTRVAPTRPYAVHIAGFVSNIGRELIEHRIATDQPGYTGTSLAGAWYREGDAFGQHLDELLFDASARPIFDSDAVERLRTEHLELDADHGTAIAAITTLEQWLQIVEDACRVRYEGPRTKAREATVTLED